MITHIIYHIPGIKVGCTKEIERRKSLALEKGKDYSSLEILEELHDKTDQEAGDIEWSYADKFGYDRGVHYTVSVNSRKTAISNGLLASQKSSKNGTHWWNGSENPGAKSNQERLDSGIHHFQGENHPSKISIRNGTHHFQGEYHPSKISIKNGTHHFLTNNPGGDSSRERAKNGTHHLLDNPNHPSKIKVSCVYCGWSTNLSGITKFHGPNAYYDNSYCKNISFKNGEWTKC